jgi:hemerythrin-like domain-containing protein
MRSETDDERFKARIKVLTEINNHHIDEEEDEIFDAIRESMSSELLDEQLRLFTEERQKQHDALTKKLASIPFKGLI